MGEMLNRLPTWLPSLNELLRDIGTPGSERVAKALGVSESTVRRWKRSSAPKTALLALWWLTRWGHSAWDAEMANRTRLALDLAEALQLQLARQNTDATERRKGWQPRIRSKPIKGRAPAPCGLLPGAPPQPPARSTSRRPGEANSAADRFRR